MNDSVRVGDRVVIRAVRHPNCERYVGRTGRVEHVFISPDLKGNYKVVLDRGFAARIIASAVEAIPERDQRELSTSEHALYAAENRDWRDEEAAVEKLHRYGIIDDETLSAELRRINDERRRTAPDKKRTQAMEFARHLLGEHARPENLIALADWALANPEEAAAKIESQRILSGAQVEKVADPEHGPYSARLQAAKDAFAAIGDGASIEEITALAEWLLNEPEAEEKVTGAEQTADHVIFTRGGFIPGPNVGPLVNEHAEPPRPPANLQIKDTDGDAVNFRCVTDRPDTVAFIVGAPAGTYITPEDADRIIAFLQDAKAARNT